MGFSDALQFTLKYEGGYVNNSHDPGGATNKGITQNAYNNYLNNKNRAPRSVAGISPLEVEDIYREEYWDRIGGDNLPNHVATALFDFAVNSGPKLALDYFRDSLLKYRMSDETNFLTYFINQRESFLRGLRIAPYFINGWVNRLNALRKYVGL